MTHEIWKELISRHVDGETTPEEERQLHNHLATCSECRDFQEDLKQLRPAIREAAVLDLGPSFVVTVNERLREEESRIDSWIAVERLARNTVMGLAFTVAVVLAVMASMRSREANAPEPTILTASNDSTAARVLLEHEELTKGDVLLAVVTK